MGMYTEIQGSVEFKSDEIAQAFIDSWEKVSELVEGVKPYVGYSRMNWIPFSGKGVVSIEESVVKFHSELKDYDSTIGKFLEMLPLIANKWCLESKYEEYNNWDLHTNYQEDMQVNGDNRHEVDWFWPKDVCLVDYPSFDVFDRNNLQCTK